MGARELFEVFQKLRMEIEVDHPGELPDPAGAPDYRKAEEPKE